MKDFELNRQFVIDERWLLDPTRSTLIDLVGHTPETILQPVSARLLALLAQSPHTIVHRRQLFDLGWRHYGFEVCENSLNQAICKLRHAFRTLKPHATVIKTMPRIGYALLADARAVSPILELPCVTITPLQAN